MNILFFGLGSIGQRHLRNLKKIYPNFNIFALRKKRKTPLLNSKNNKIKGTVEKKYKVNSINNLNYLVKNNILIDGAFICSPSSFHVKQCLWCIKKGIHFFSEKPVAVSIGNLMQINNQLKNKKIVNFVGYQLRFNPIIKYIKKNIFEKKILGDVLFSNIYHGEHVDNFHSYESYKNSYTSKKKLGGGVIFTQIHELDYFRYFFEGYKIKKFNSFKSKISKLTIDVEDTYTTIFFLKKKKKKIFVNLTCSFLQVPKKREIFISCSKGDLVADLNSLEIKIRNKGGSIKLKKFSLDRNSMFENEVRLFIEDIKKFKTSKKISHKNQLPTVLDDFETNLLALKIKS